MKEGMGRQYSDSVAVPSCQFDKRVTSCHSCPASSQKTTPCLPDPKIIVSLPPNFCRMEKIYFTDLVPAEQSQAGAQLREWQRKYPASPLLNMFALKDPAARIPHRNRVRMLLTLPDKLRFDLLPLETAPVVEVREKPQLNIVETKEKRPDNLNPIFVKHPAPNHEDRQALIDQLIEKFSKDAPKIIYSPDTHDAEADYGQERTREWNKLMSATSSARLIHSNSLV